MCIDNYSHRDVEMTRPVMDNFTPFTLESLSTIRMLRIQDLSEPNKPMKRKSPPAHKLDRKTQQILEGLDPETQRILQALMKK